MQTGLSSALLEAVMNRQGVAHQEGTLPKHKLLVFMLLLLITKRVWQHAPMLLYKIAVGYIHI
jgi:hypothetical protein